ncbi:MAG TPA: dihydrodipicolinate synthase family protein [Pirellulaceae bacterium]|nr:dihydrodipicolinate synthase family protein [Pirellulaceae bacterium]
MTSRRFRLIAPPTTPFHADGSLNLEAVEQQAQLLVDTSVDGVFVAGSTGEGQSLSTAERMRSAERWIEVAAGTGLEVIIQVGHNSLPDAVALAEHAQRIGADSIAASSPCYFKPARVEELIDFLAPVASAAADLPFYYYEIPPLTLVALPMVEFLTKAKPRIPNLVGLKYSNIDLMQMQQCVRMNDGEFELLFGSDQQLLAAVALGACGAVGSTYNFAAPLYRRMLAAFDRGDHATARELQAKSVEVVAIMARTNFLSACKILLTELGIENGPVRAPLRNLTTEQRDKLLADLNEAGVFDLQKVEVCEGVESGLPLSRDL